MLWLTVANSVELYIAAGLVSGFSNKIVDAKYTKQHANCNAIVLECSG